MLVIIGVALASSPRGRIVEAPPATAQIVISWYHRAPVDFEMVPLGGYTGAATFSLGQTVEASLAAWLEAMHTSQDLVRYQAVQGAGGWRVEPVQVRRVASDPWEAVGASPLDLPVGEVVYGPYRGLCESFFENTGHKCGIGGNEGRYSPRATLRETLEVSNVGLATGWVVGRFDLWEPGAAVGLNLGRTEDDALESLGFVMDGPITRQGDAAPADTGHRLREAAQRAAFEDRKLLELLAVGQRFSSTDALAAALAQSMTPSDLRELVVHGWSSETSFLTSVSHRWMSPFVRDGSPDHRLLWADDVPQDRGRFFDAPPFIER